jgi:serine protease Do
LGDKVVVVGNQLGGGVATQLTGQIKGIGPDRVEVDATFQPGNSGSPIFDVTCKQVVGVATFTYTLTVDINGNPADATNKANPGVKTETHWFGFRLDSVPRWESIDWARWQDQVRQVDDFRDASIALWNVYQGNLAAAGKNPRLRSLIERYESRTAGTPAEQAGDFVRAVKAYAGEGEKDFAGADYNDYFHTSLAWATSVPRQVKYRDLLITGFGEVLSNLPAYLARLKK